ncbi:hypothetical protein A2U01_0069064, partial [Trifolium medium]|nr:hypothetical protein [Trifolium medium]
MQEGTSTPISSIPPIDEEIMVDPEPNNNNNNNANVGGAGNVGGGGGGVRPCHNSPRRLAHLARPQRGARQTEMKTGLLQLLYVNPFSGLPHEDPYNHLVKFYE